MQSSNLCVLAIFCSWLVASTAQAAQLYSQPSIPLPGPSPHGVFSNRPIPPVPNPLGDHYAFETSMTFDNFNLSSRVQINQIQFTGGFDIPFPPGSQRGEIDFVFRIYRNLAGDVPDTLEGDYNDDGKVGLIDQSLVLREWGRTPGVVGPFPEGWVDEVPAGVQIGLVPEQNRVLSEWGKALPDPDNNAQRIDGGTAGELGGAIAKVKLNEALPSEPQRLRYTANLAPITLDPGNYWLSIQAEQTHPTVGEEASWFWVFGTGGDSLTYSYDEKFGDRLKPGLRLNGFDMGFTLNGNVITSAPASASVPEPGSNLGLLHFLAFALWGLRCQRFQGFPSRGGRRQS